MRIKHIYKFFLVTCVLVVGTAQDGAAQFYYGLQQDFGKNRVQYQDFMWSYYAFDRFDTYFYKQGRQVAQYVSRIAEEDLEFLETLLDYRLTDHMQLVVYNNLTDFKQSNVGLPSTDEMNNTGGLSKIVGSKLYVYFDGDHRNLRTQLRAGIVQVLLNQMMYGGNIREVVSNNTLLTLPEWYEKGLIAYLSDPENEEYENYVIDGVLSGRYKSFKTIQGKDHIYAGFGIWQYIGEMYSPNVISQILYMTRVNRGVESGFTFVLGKDLETIMNDWLEYTKEKYTSLETMPSMEGVNLARKNHKGVQFIHMALSPESGSLVYVRNNLGKFKVFLTQLPEGESKVVFKGGYAIDEYTDYSFPMLAWHPTGDLLAIISEEKGHSKLHFYDVKKEELISKDLFQFEKVLSFCYAPDGKHFLMSAIREGQSDIYMYSILANSFEKLTDDVYDDFDPIFIKPNRIVFASTRPNTNYPIVSDSVPAREKTDLFLYEIGGIDPLKNITNTDQKEEADNIMLADSKFQYSAPNGKLRQVYQMTIDSSIAFIDTTTHYYYEYKSTPISNYNRPILGHSQIGRFGEKVWRTLNGGKELLSYQKKGDFDGKEEMVWEEGVEVNQIEPILLKDKKEIRPGSYEVNILDYQFHPDLKEEFNIPQKQVEVVVPADEKNDSTEVEEEFVFPAQSNYRLSFFSEYFVSELDKNFLTPVYQPYSGGGSALFLTPPLSGLFKLGLGETFGDYKIIGAARIGVDFRNNEFYLSFMNLRRQWDKTYTFNRKTLFQQYSGDEIHKVITHQGIVTLTYPFNPVSALSFTGGFRLDEDHVLAVNQFRAEEETDFDSRITAGSQWIYDNTLSKGLNLYAGTRFKIFGEYYQSVGDEDPLSLFVLGADFRHYYPIHRNFILANRFACSASFGKQRLIYYLGGVDNWWGAKYNPDTPIDQATDYAFQTLATNMRGFHQNIRNGNNFFVYNTELRFPVFSYLLNRPVKSDILRNFQIVGFTDVGTAWNGLTPYSAVNAFNNQVIQQGGITVVLDKQKNPFVLGYGAGFRTRIAGYFMRFDWAWGLEDGIVLPRVFYFSTSLDF